MIWTLTYSSYAYAYYRCWHWNASLMMPLSFKDEKLTGTPIPLLPLYVGSRQVTVLQSIQPYHRPYHYYHIV
jgi:hypothetical protein